MCSRCHRSLAISDRDRNLGAIYGCKIAVLYLPACLVQGMRRRVRRRAFIGGMVNIFVYCEQLLCALRRGVNKPAGDDCIISKANFTLKSEYLGSAQTIQCLSYH